MITFALSKGRLATESADLLARCGVDTAVLYEETRKLVLSSADGNFRFFLVKPSDVPVYVEAGVADLGVVGKDTLIEEDRDIYEMLDLKIGECSLCLAGYPERKDVLTSPALRVATKYVNTAKRLFSERGEDVEIIPLHGSIELAPVTDLSDVIFDVVQTGSTLKANGLVVLEQVFTGITARLVANKVSLKTKSAEILPLIAKVKEEVA
ncbi:MAG: ATP phosphoribosyltransferase [Bacillota bacterium]|uniref:ATP phosphoribosyltransferase n=1 Tax=Candidatus Gallimonas intestinavium TaxID=2838603 RepID=A0A9D2G5G5_9FIRM|nr:MAG: ATP phosphoribosyltransferase [Bacillota bacterium]HIZ72490.1 ATP phosphoribosyltransferase [Candidatus Gallimonas intestinavium]